MQNENEEWHDPSREARFILPFAFFILHFSFRRWMKESRWHNAFRISWKTPCQFPRSRCRNSRIVGYQGLSLRSSSQRQSGAKGSATQTGTPSAPARWATAVSQVITRSRFIITAAVSMNAPAVQAAAQVRDRKAVADLCATARRPPLLQAEQADPGKPASGSKQLKRDRAGAVVLRCRASLPGDADLEAGNAAQLLPPVFDQARVGEEVGIVGGNRFQGGVEDAGQAQQRGLDVEGRQLVSLPRPADRCPRQLAKQRTRAASGIPRSPFRLAA